MNILAMLVFVWFCLRLYTKGIYTVLLILLTLYFYFSSDDNFLCFTKHEPVGVCGAIIPVSIWLSSFSLLCKVLCWQAWLYLCMMEKTGVWGVVWLGLNWRVLMTTECDVILRVVIFYPDELQISIYVMMFGVISVTIWFMNKSILTLK